MVYWVFLYFCLMFFKINNIICLNVKFGNYVDFKRLFYLIVSLISLLDNFLRYIKFFCKIFLNVV